MKMRILVALDESRWSAAAATTALRMAAASPEDVDLCAVHVVPVAPLSGVLLRDLAGLMGFEPVLVPEQVDAAYRARGQVLLDRFKARCEAAGLSHSLHLDRGNTVTRLVHHANDCDLMICGVRGEDEELDPGSGGGTLERLVRRSPISMLIVSDTAPRMERVAIGYDGSEGAQCAIKAVRHLAEVLDFEARLMFVGQEEGILEPAQASLERDGIKTECIVMDGEPHEVLAAGAMDAGADLLVMGYRGRSWLSDVLLGRVTEFLLGELPIAMLVAR